MSIIKKLEQKYCINTDRRELGQAYFRPIIFLVCVLYSIGLSPTGYMLAVGSFAFIATITIIICVWRNIGQPKVRHICTMVYDAFIMGLVIAGLGSEFIGLYGVLLWIPMGYSFRYKSIEYLKLAVALMVVVFCLTAVVNPWQDHRIFWALLVTLIGLPLSGMAPILREVNETNQKLNKSNEEKQETVIKLEEAMKVKAQFMTNMSHDLQTPVNGIVGWCESEWNKSPAIKGIRNSIDQLSRLINVLLGKENEETSDVFSPQELIEQSMLISKPAANSKNITFEVINESDEHYYGASFAVSRCLMNLVSNAVKYADAGSIITFSTRPQKYGVGFSVSNTGASIPENELQHIFDPFYRAENSSGLRGSGLGLSIVKDTIDKLRGTIKAESTNNKTTFEFFIPAQKFTRKQWEDLEMSVSNEIEAATIYRDASILFVDDDHEARVSWSIYLRNNDYHVYAAANGKEALTAIEAGNKFNLFLLDYRMPGMNGLELAARIRALDVNAKIVLISADVNTDPGKIFKTALAVGAVDGALPKPISSIDLLSLISRLTDNPNHETTFNEDDVLAKVQNETIRLQNALEGGHTDAADNIYHKVKASVSRIDDEGLQDAIRQSTQPLEALKILQQHFKQ